MCSACFSIAASTAFAVSFAANVFTSTSVMFSALIEDAAPSFSMVAGDASSAPTNDATEYSGTTAPAETVVSCALAPDAMSDAATNAAAPIKSLLLRISTTVILEDDRTGPDGAGILDANDDVGPNALDRKIARPATTGCDAAHALGELGVRIASATMRAGWPPRQSCRRNGMLLT